MWFWKRSKQKREVLHVRAVRWLGPQDGPYEQILKDRLVEFFRRDGRVRRAFLARADMGTELGVNVVLALCAESGPNERTLDGVGRVFAEIFNAKAHLDIRYLSETQEATLASLCAPFFDVPTK